MDFSKTRIYQRTRLCYDKLYLEYNERKSNRRPRNSGGVGEGGGSGATARVGEDNSKGKSSGKSGEGLRGSDEREDEIDPVARRTRRGRREESVKVSKKGKNGVVDELEDNDGGDDGTGLKKYSLRDRVKCGGKEASGSEKAEKNLQKDRSRKRGKTACQNSLVDEVDDDGVGDDDGVEVIKSSGDEKAEKTLQRGKSRKRGKTVCQNSLVDEVDGDGDDDGVEVIKSSGDEKVEKTLQRGQSRKRSKTVRQNSLVDADDDGVEFIQSSGGNQSKTDVKVVNGIGKATKDCKSVKTIDPLQNGDLNDDDVRSHMVDDCKLSKSSGRETGFLNKTTASHGDGLKGKSGSGNKFDRYKFDEDNSLSSSGFPPVESEDDDGVVYLGDDVTCLDDYDPSHSSRVESNEVKVNLVELDSIIADADDAQGLKSPEEEDDDSRNMKPPEQERMEPTENAAVGDHDFTVITLSSSSEREDNEEDGNAMNNGDDGSSVLEGGNNDDLGEQVLRELLRQPVLDDGHEDETDDCELLNHFSKKTVNESEKKNKNVNVLEPRVSKKRYGSDNEMWKAVEGGLKKRGTDKVQSLSCGRKAKGSGEDNFWQIVDEKGTKTAHKSTSKLYDEFGNKVNMIKILTDTMRDERDVDKLLERFVNIPVEGISTEKTPVDQVHSYKFKFEDEDDMKPEKLESEMEVDGLFDEMNMCLQLSEIGSSGASVVNCGDADLLAEGTNQVTCCRQGKHHLTINDEFGIICRYCSFVEMEIRDILPPLSKNERGGHGRHEYEKTDGLKFSDLRLGDCPNQDRHLDCKGSEYERGTVWDLVPGVKESMYTHQRDGFEFIWKKIAGGICIDKLEKRLPAGGSGCIISHAPGTGKSRLTIVFLQAFMKMYPDSRPMIIAPRCMLLTWEEEFKKWNVDFPFYILNSSECSGQEDTRATNLLKQSGNGKSLLGRRLLKLYSWRKKSSVLGITYRLFESLAGEEGKKKQAINNDEDEPIRKILLQVPTLVVLDEGHTPRNDQSYMWKALLNVKTKRSIILSGTPFQNNFDELYNTLCLVNPLLSFGISSLSGVEFRKKRGWKNYSAKGQWDSITSAIKKSKENVIKLRDMIDPFVHVHKGTILQEKLPGLRDALVVLKPTKTQQALLGRMPASLTLENDRLMSFVSVHPSLLSTSSENEVFSKVLNVFKNDPVAGVKTHFLIELIKLSGALNEKVLVFSQWIKPLEFIMDLLKFNLRWVEGREFLYMDGQQEEKHRQTSINTLNDPKSEVKVLLASMKACSEGINLVGASRVVLLDVHWNPSVERQAISRAYRLGQTKLVHVYHLVTGSMEGEKYIRQVEKSHLSELVFSSENKDNRISKISPTVAEDKILAGMVQHDKLQHMFEKVIYQPKEADLIATFG